MGGWSHRHPEPSTYQEACLPEGKRTFNINHTVYISSLVRHSEPSISVLRMVGNRLKSKFPDTRQRPTLLAGLSKNSSLRSAVVFSAQPTWLLGTKQMVNILGFYCHNVIHSGLSVQQGEAIISSLPCPKSKEVPARRTENRCLDIRSSMLPVSLARFHDGFRTHRHVSEITGALTQVCPF